MSSNGDIFRLAKEGLVDELKALLSQPNIDINTTDSNRFTALHYAAMNGKRDAVELLLKKGADINAKDGGGGTPLILVAKKPEETVGQEVAKLLLSAKDIDVNHKDGMDRTALMYAAAAGNYQITRLLLRSEKVDINHQTYSGDTALFSAVGSGRDEMVRLLLHYGALRGTKDFGGRTAQELARSRDGMTGQKMSEIFEEFPNVLQDERRSDKPELPLRGRATWPSPKLQWAIAGSGTVVRENVAAVDLSPLPKDTLRKEVVSVVEGAKRLMCLDHEEGKLGEQWIWIHVPCNNILWVRWAIQHLPASYKMDDGANLIGMIDEAFDELKQSPHSQMVRCTRKGQVVSIVMPYLAVETEESFNKRTEDSLEEQGLWEPANYERHKVKERKHILQLPQPLDQSHFASDQLPKARDRDPVGYRYTEAARLQSSPITQVRLLMVNQVWLWQVKNMVVTAFPAAWTFSKNPLFDSLNDRSLNQLSIQDFVDRMLRQCVLLSDEPGYRSCRQPEPWPSIFAKRTISVAQVETDRYKMFSNYIRNVSVSNRLDREQPKEEAELDREFKALYDICPETEGLRQARRIRDELKMIGGVLGHQEVVINGWLLGNWGDRVLGFAFKERQDTLREIDKEAEDVERRFNQLLDFKQKQGSLNFARDADKREKESEKRDKENEKQSKLFLAFTIITVIFTPLNFVAAFMAIPTNEYPHRESNVNWSWWQSFLGMLVAEIVVVLPTAWLWRKSVHGGGGKKTEATKPSKPLVDSKLSNKGDGVV
ncbi:hypothetical protein CC80DRAFT_588726 [Byssothecium circinans]|uniref:Uncharacterized protein n=1 Tax=Byssothecium circinans TaxID=147558 RepID=A0A6A5UDT3_9PLEO|nr:hypothetical protein CC80DRAFT_588726 [Byssothecium circinans]